MDPVEAPATQTDWPSFDLPAEVTRDEPAPAVAATDPATPPATDPATQPATDPAAQPTAQPTTPTGGPAGPTAEESVPKYRLDDQRTQFEGVIAELRAQNERLTALVERSVGGQRSPAAEPPPEPPDPQRAAIREKLFEAIPELAWLEKLRGVAERSDELFKSADTVKQITAAEAAHYDRYANRTFDTLFDKIAALTLGEGKTGKDVPDLVKPGVVSSWVRWVTTDKARSARYDAEDPKLVDEFWGLYKAATFDTARRDAAVATLQRGTPAVPVGGGGHPVASAVPQPKPSNLDEDEIHNRAWAARDSVGV